MAVLTQHRSGAFSFLPGGTSFSQGLVVAPGFRLAEWEFTEPVPLPAAFERLAVEFAARGLEWTALAGVDLRSPEPFSAAGFAAFNEAYEQLVDRYYPIADGDWPPYARTNVAPLGTVVAEPSVRAVQVVEAKGGAKGDFLLSGVAENRGGLAPADIVAHLDASATGMQAKVDYVVSELAARCVALGVSPDDARIVDVYASHALEWLDPVIADTFRGVSAFGLHRWLARPPVDELEFEMGVKRVSCRVILDDES